MPARRLAALLALALAATLLLTAFTSPAPASGASATAAKAKVCKQRKGETRKRWQKRCKCAKPKRGESRKRFKKRCVARKPVAQRPIVPPPPAPPVPAPPILEPVRNDAGFAAVLGRTNFLRTYQPSPSATHSESYYFCATRIEPHSYEGIAYIYESRGPWQVIEGYVNGDGSKGFGTIRFVQEQANFASEVGKEQIIKYTWPAPGTDRADVARIEHPEIGSYLFARSVRSSTC